MWLWELIFGLVLVLVLGSYAIELKPWLARFDDTELALITPWGGFHLMLGGFDFREYRKNVWAFDMYRRIPGTLWKPQDGRLIYSHVYRHELRPGPFERWR